MLHRRGRLGDNAPQAEPGINAEVTLRHRPARIAGEIAVAEIVMHKNLRRQFRRWFGLGLRRGRRLAAAMIFNGIAQIPQQARIRLA